jgi:hypothetical protein
MNQSLVYFVCPPVGFPFNFESIYKVKNAQSPTEKSKLLSFVKNSTELTSVVLMAAFM